MSQHKKSSNSTEKKPRSSKHSRSSSKAHLEQSEIKRSPSQPKEEINVEQKYKEIQLKDKICVTHQYPLNLFCETCEEPICQQCAIIGPHNSQLHRLNELAPAYIGRKVYLDDIIRQKVLVKREAMVAQIHRIEFRIEELHYVKTLIERDARVEHSEIIQELKSTEGNKLAILQNEMAVLQKDLDSINDIQQFFWKMTTQSADPIAFLLQYQKMRQHLQKIIEKPFKNRIDVNAQDLPRVLTQKRLQFADANANNALLAFKNLVIFQLVQQTKEIQANRKSNMNEAMNKEISNWIQLAEKFVQRLQQFSFCCYYCGKLFKVKNVNSTCKSNKVKQTKDFIGYTINEPDNSFHENQKHFWGQPKDDKMKVSFYKLRQFCILKERLEKKLQKIQKLQEKFSKKQQDPKKQQLEEYKYQKKLFKNKFRDKKDLIFFEMQLAKIKQNISEKNIDLRKLFESHDKAKTNLLESINYIQFSYILTEILGVNVEDIDKILNLLDLDKSKQIEYERVIPIILDPHYIENVVKPRKKKNESKENIQEQNDQQQIDFKQ